MLSKLLVHVTKRHKDKMTTCLRNLGIYVGQDIFLLTLQAHGSLTQKELKEKLMVEFATIHKIVNRSEKRGLVTKTKDPDDMRVSIVALTRAGEEVTVKIKECWKKLEDDFFAALNEEEKTQLQNLLSKLNQ